MRVGNIGKTVEERDIKIVEINSNDSRLPVIFIDAGLHAPEWISTASIIFFIEKLSNMVASGKGKKSIARFQWHILPLVNPDGYEYSRKIDRNWRKNRARIPGSECIGVDLNRNFPEGYGIGASSDPCSNVYKGTHPISEPESKALADYVRSLKNIKAAISVHSYGNVIIYPWGHKRQKHPNVKRLRKLARYVTRAIWKRSFVGPSV